MTETKVSLCMEVLLMAESPFGEHTTCNPKESICIDAQRIYDSCGDKDCLSDLRVYFTEQSQSVIDGAVSVRIKSADVITVYSTLEQVPFHRGFYSVDMTFFFDVAIEAFMSPGSCPVTVNGLAIHSKKVILYGSEGSVKTFTSEYNYDECDCKQLQPSQNLPKATVQVATPIALSAKVCECKCPCNPPCRIPESICRRFGGDFLQNGSMSVYATIGIFTIVQIERNVQMLIPAYDFCIPEKECVTTSDNPCEMFNRLEFPTNEFFPPTVCDIGEENKKPDCGCK